MVEVMQKVIDQLREKLTQKSVLRPLPEGIFANWDDHEFVEEEMTKLGFTIVKEKHVWLLQVSGITKITVLFSEFIEAGQVLFIDKLQPYRWVNQMKKVVFEPLIKDPNDCIWLSPRWGHW